MTRPMLALIILGALSAPAFAQPPEPLEVSELPVSEQDDPGHKGVDPEQAADDPLLATAEPKKAGPVEFHVIPELGAGVFLQDNVIEFSKNTGFVMIRFPGLVLPNFNGTSSGLQFEFMNAPVGLGVEYSILSYTRTKVAGPMYTGGNIRIARGFSSEGAAFDAEVTAVIGLKLLTLGGHVPIKLEIELLEQDRPVKALLVLTWE